MKFKTLFPKLLKLYWRPFDFLDLKGVGCEVGVNHGIHAQQMLNRHRGKISMMFLVDPYPTEGYTQESERPAAELAAKKRLLSSYPVWFCKQDAKGFNADYFKGNPILDFCYIDGDHSYTSVEQDIAAIWPMIKSGGIMGGHDFHHTWQGVIDAVTDFTVDNKLKLHVETPDWWVVKP